MEAITAARLVARAGAFTSDLAHGAWIVAVVVPVAVAVVVLARRQRDRAASVPGVSHPDPVLDRPRRLDAVVLVAGLDDGVDRAMRYVEGLGADRARAVHIGPEDRAAAAAFWARHGRPLEFVPRRRGLVRTARALVRAERTEYGDHVVAVVVPAAGAGRRRWRPSSWDEARRLETGLLFDPDVIVVRAPTGAGSTPVDRPRRRHVALVPVAAWQPASADALRIAQVLGANSVRAVHVLESTESADTFERAWGERGIRVPLDIVAGTARAADEPLLHEVAAIKAHGADLVTVVVAEPAPRWWWCGRLRRAPRTTARLRDEPGVAIVSVVSAGSGG